MSLSMLDLAKAIPGTQQTLPSTVATAFITHLDGDLHGSPGLSVLPARGPRSDQPHAWHTVNIDRGLMGERTNTRMSKRKT